MVFTGNQSPTNHVWVQLLGLSVPSRSQVQSSVPLWAILRRDLAFGYGLDAQSGFHALTDGDQSIAWRLGIADDRDVIYQLL